MSGMIGAVMEATRQQEQQSAVMQREVELARRDKEIAVETMGAQIRNIHAQHQQELEGLRQAIAKEKEATGTAMKRELESHQMLSELRTAFDKTLQAHTDELRQLQEVKESTVVDATKQWAAAVQRVQYLERRLIQESACASAEHLRCVEIAGRSYYAVSATSERHTIATTRVQGKLWEKDKMLVKVQGELLAEVQRTKALETQLSDTVSAAKQKIHLLEQEVAAAQADAKEATRRVEKLTDAVETISGQFADATTEIQALTVSNEQLQKQSDQLRDDVKQQHVEAVENKKKFEAALADAKKREQALEADLAASSKALKDTESFLKNNADLAKEKTLALLELQRATEEATQRTAKEHTAEKDALVSAHKRILQENADASTLQVAELRGAVETLKNQLRFANTQNAELVSERDRFQEQASALKSAYATATMDRDSTTTEADRLRSINSVLERDLKVCQDTCDRFEAINNKLQGERCGLVSELKESTERMGQWQSRAHELSKEKVALSQGVGALEDELKRLQDRVSELTAENAAMNEELDGSQGKRALIAQLSKRSQELATAREKLSDLTEKLVVTEASYCSTATRLHHSMEESANTSTLLSKGLHRIRAEASDDESRKAMTAATQTIRSALEGEGFDSTTLPLPPTSTLNSAYLQQVLLDHASLCAQHLNKLSRTSGSTVVPSALRTPKVYQTPSHSVSIVSPSH